MKRKLPIRFAVLGLVVAMCISATTACSTLQTQAETTDGTTIELVSGPLTAEYKNKDLDTEYSSSSASAVCGDKVTVSGSGISEAEGVITISKEGVYVLSGNYKGQVLVDTDKDAYVHIVLDGFEIANENGPAVYAKKCDKLTITLADNSVNSITDGSSYTNVDDDGEPDAALFSESDMSLNGNGSLTVTGNYADAIKCKKDLKFISGTYKISAASEGIKGRNSVTIKDGTFDITAKDTAIKSTRDDSAEKGYIIIDGGSITINAGNDGIHSETHTTINGGDINIETAYEGIEGQMIDITGGNINVVATDDGINATRIGSSSNKGGNGGFGGDKGDGNKPDMNKDGDKADKPNGKDNGGTPLEMPNGTEDGGTPPETPNGTEDGGTPPEMPNGTEDGGTPPEMPNGTDNGNRPQIPDDKGGNRGDKQNPPDGDNKGGGDHGFGGGEGNSSDDGQVYINISGGTVTVVGGGDCIDSNGALYLSGGTVYSSSERFGITDPDAVLDADGSIELKSGLTFIGTGTSSEISSLEVEQNIAYIYLDEKKSGTITIYDGSTVLASYKPKYSFGCIAVTSPGFEQGKTYTLDINGEKTEFTVSAQETTVGTPSSGGMGGGNMGGMEKNKISFTDVSSTASYYKAVSFLSQMGAMSGTSETEFSPDATLTRAMAVSVLGRLAKGTPTGEASSFSDVADGMYYTDYVKWAAENSIVSGYGNGIFGVNDSITAKQLQIILSNYAKTAGFEYTADEDADDTPVTRGEFAEALFNAFSSSQQDQIPKHGINKSGY